jgi:Mn2+/Fe2+ NRAMP family transporter
MAFTDKLGPGLIFAAAAVGTSHIVQSTRAGAAFGLTLGGLILLICVLKYPLFRFAVDYAAITGENLVQGYARHSRALVVLMFLASAIEAVAAVAGVSLVTTSILLWTLGAEANVIGAAIGVLCFTALLVIVGRYRTLERVTAVLVVVFSVLTVAVTLASIPSLAPDPGAWFSPFPLNSANFSFAIAVSGWMPIGNTAAIMLAAWILARRRLFPVSLADARFDFNTGYWTSVSLAFCFLLLGTAMLHGSGTQVPDASGAFVTTFVELYTRTTGEGLALVVSILALSVMFSTLLAIVDGFPRLIAEFIAVLRHGADGGASETGRSDAGPYLGAMLAVVGSAGVLLYVFLDSFADFIDLVTIIGFLAAPVVALANQLVVTGHNVPADLQPGRTLRIWNVITVGVLTLATLGFLYFRFL